MVAFSAKPSLIAFSTTSRFITGSVPGSAHSTTLACAFGSAPNAVDAPLKILDCVLSWTWISKPITVSQVMVIRFLFLLNDDWTMKTRAAFARRFHPAWHSGGGTSRAFGF